jgi:hypothetical protein
VLFADKRSDVRRVIYDTVIFATRCDLRRDALTTRRGRRGIPGTGSVEHSREAALLAMMRIDGADSCTSALVWPFRL